MADDHGDEEPKTATQHLVHQNETLNSIAAMYDLTPSQLKTINRLTSQYVYPGQVLKLVAPEPTPPAPAKPRMVKLPLVKQEVGEDTEMYEYRFVRLNVRHITDGHGVALGSILFTPKSLMFDPNPTDPLVAELEPDQFQIIAPMELIVNAVIFYDFPKLQSINDVKEKEVIETKVFHGECLDEECCPAGSDAANCSKGDNAENTQKDNNELNQSFSDEPLYLRIVMGKPIGKKLPRTSPLMSYGEQTLQPEYWFLIKRYHAQYIYRFFRTWCPEVYGLLDVLEIEKRGYEIIRTGRPILEEESGRTANRESVSKMIRRTMTMSIIDQDLMMPALVGKSELISDSTQFALVKVLPYCTDGHDWHLMFSSSNDGFSLHSVYRKLADVEGPILMILKCTSDAIFGAYLSCRPRVTEHFEGTGESFLFRVTPDFHVFNWTGENEYFFKGNPHSLVVGSGNGKFGLWLDEDLNQGRTQQCPTFDNTPLTTEDFTIKVLECWAFVI